MTRFEVIEHTADVGIVGYGSDFKEAFANTAYGMFSLIADLEDLNYDFSHDIDIQAPDREALLVTWLNELIYTFDVDRVVLNVFEITGLNDNRLQAKVFGEKIDRSHRQLKTAVKAATYHSLRIEDSNGVRIQVILDI
jgi:SHS2 domain-containing protein